MLTVALVGYVVDRRAGAEASDAQNAPASQLRGFADGGRVDGRVTGVAADTVPPGGIDGVARARGVGVGGLVEGVRLGSEGATVRRHANGSG